MTERTLDILLYVDEGQPPLARGQEISGIIVAMVPASRVPGKRDALIQPGGDAPRWLQGGRLYVTPRYRNETWDDFRAGKQIAVNVGFLDVQKKEVARGIGHVHLGNTHPAK